MSNKRFEDRIVFITGGNSGIGAAAARAFAAEGARVAIAARREEEGHQVVEQIVNAGGQATFFATDVADAAQVQSTVSRVIETYGALHVAFNNAGGGRHFGLLADQSVEGWREEIDVNLSGIFYAMKYELPALLASGGGTIINNASQLGLVGIAGGVAPYVAAKHGVVGLTRAAALEYAEQGVRVNVIAPAGVDTPLFRGTMGATDEGAEQIRGMHPIKRIAQPEEVAGLVLYLASDEATFFTGASIAMDGGWTAQ